VERDFVRGRWSRLLWRYGGICCGPQDTWSGERDCPDANLAYLLGINKNHPRDRPPWRSLGGRLMDGSLFYEDEPFFLTYRTVGELFGIGRMTAWRWLQALRFYGVIEQVEPGTLKDRQAATWRYVGG
jgi:hypothetical protein